MVTGSYSNFMEFCILGGLLNVEKKMHLQIYLSLTTYLEHSIPHFSIYIPSSPPPITFPILLLLLSLLLLHHFVFFQLLFESYSIPPTSPLLIFFVLLLHFIFFQLLPHSYSSSHSSPFMPPPPPPLVLHSYISPSDPH